MPNWRKITEENLKEIRVAPERKEEIIAELSAHLEDLYEDLLRQGRSEEDAHLLASNTLKNNTRLCKKIQSVEHEDVMNDRVRTLWLPALVAIVASLTMPQMLHAQPSYKDLLNNLQRMQGPIPHRLSSAVYLFFDWRWLLVLPAVGAVAAYWSRLQGGRLWQRALAATAPALGFGGSISLFIFIVSLPHIGQSLESIGIWLRALATVFGLWVVLPAVALLLGALPFLQNQNRSFKPLTIAQ